jgi:hypothetical protein
VHAVSEERERARALGVRGEGQVAEAGHVEEQAAVDEDRRRLAVGHQLDERGAALGHHRAVDLLAEVDDLERLEGADHVAGKGDRPVADEAGGEVGALLHLASLSNAGQQCVTDDT